MPTHSILGGKVHLYRRMDGGTWHCSTYYQGKNHRKSTKVDTLPHAEEIAEGWYLELRGKARAGLLKPRDGKPFNQAADLFLDEYKASVANERSERWIKEHEAHIKNHLKPYFGKYTVPEIDKDLAQLYRLARIEQGPKRPKKKKAKEGDTNAPAPPPAAKAKDEPQAKPKTLARSTLDNEIITLRMILKMCERKKWIKAVPDLKPSYKKQMKKIPRPWFSPEEYTKLYLAARAYAQRPQRERFRWDAEQLYDKILFLANTGLRPDEAANLEHRDVKMVKDQSTGELILEIEVRGKVGYGPCKSRPDAVKVYQRLLNRPKWVPQGRKPRSAKDIKAAEGVEPPVGEKPKPTDKVFPGNHIKLFNKILKDKDLKFNRDGLRHSLYSLRHTYISMRLTEGADIYQLSKNCRTSVEIIQDHYASHIMNAIDAAAINTRKLRRKPQSLERMD